ncbi:MAG: Rrf2 family transcriptional regulator [Gemmataceae bacterium]|nr:Rrf2 family transcriptional regulator [Gemmataceae bacterium]
MKLTRASSYAIHAVAYMAAQKKGDPIASHIIAQDRKIPERFLLKVLKPLVSAQILMSIKGPNGGYRLAKQANEVTLLDVVEAVDGPVRGNAPPNPKNPNSQLDKRLEQICGQSADALRKQLGKVKLSELITKD